MKENLKYRYNQLGVVSDIVLVMLMLVAFVLGFVVCKVTG